MKIDIGVFGFQVDPVRTRLTASAAPDVFQAPSIVVDNRRVIGPERNVPHFQLVVNPDQRIGTEIERKAQTRVEKSLEIIGIADGRGAKIPVLHVVDDPANAVIAANEQDAVVLLTQRRWRV